MIETINLINMEKVEDYVLKQDKHAQLVYLKRRLEDLEQVHKEGKKQVTLTLSNITCQLTNHLACFRSPIAQG